MKKIKTILIILLLPFALYGIVFLSNKNNLTNTVQAVGNLTVTYLGLPLGAPVFNVTGLLPGGPALTRTIKVKNDGKNTSQIYVKGIRRGPTGQTDPKLETALNFDIYEGSKHLYTGKLSKFFTDSNDKNGIRLDNIQKGKTENFDFKVNFPAASGNEYQNKSVVFDITFAGNSGEVLGDHDDNRDDDKHPDRGNDDKGHKKDDDRHDFKKKFDDDVRKVVETCKSVINKIKKK